MLGAQAVCGPGQRLRFRQQPPIEVPFEGELKPRILAQRVAISPEPAAQRAHHSADMLADNNIANADLAKLTIHILNENLGQQRYFGCATLPLPFKSQENERQHRRHHIEAAVERVGNLALDIPFRPPRCGHHGLIERLQLCSLLSGAEEFRQDRHACPYTPSAWLAASPRAAY